MFLRIQFILLCATLTSCSIVKRDQPSKVEKCLVKSNDVRWQDVSVMPYAILVKGRPGWVKSPFTPNSTAFNAVGYPENIPVKDPETGRLFLIPKLPQVPARAPFHILKQGTY